MKRPVKARPLSKFQVSPLDGAQYKKVSRKTGKHSNEKMKRYQRGTPSIHTKEIEPSK